MKPKGSRASDNVFEDVGFSAREAGHLKVKADLLIGLQEAIARRRLRQSEVARILRITQPRVSNLLSGRLDLFSTDALIDFLARLGIGVRLSLKPLKKKPGRVA